MAPTEQRDGRRWVRGGSYFGAGALAVSRDDDAKGRVQRGEPRDQKRWGSVPLPSSFCQEKER